MLSGYSTGLAQVRLLSSDAIRSQVAFDETSYDVTFFSAFCENTLNIFSFVQ